MSQETRIEKDSLGEVVVPASALYGAQSQRAIDNFLEESCRRDRLDAGTRSAASKNCPGHPDYEIIRLKGVITCESGERWELQLKGAGPTPYSRMADGRAVLRSSIREFLCSEAMHHLGVPTTRALSLMLTGDEIMRDMFYDGHPKMEPGAIVCRVAPSFLRFHQICSRI